MLNVTNRESFRQFERFPKRMARFLGFPSTRPTPTEDAPAVADFLPPVVDIYIYETDREYLIKLDMPEVTREEMKVYVEGGVLTIRGQQKFRRNDRPYGPFLRTFTVPPDADDNKIDAEFKEGVLKVRLFKSEKGKPKTIDVKVS